MATATLRKSHSQSKRSLKPNNLALMVKIGWTDAKVVNFTAIETFQLQAVTMNTKERKIKASAIVTVLAGTTIYFSRSDSMEGYYYFNRVTEQGVVGCTCPHYTAKHACTHQAGVLATHESKKSREHRAVVAEFSTAVEQIESSTTASEVESTSTPKIEEAKHELATAQQKLDALTDGKAPAEVLKSDCTPELRARIWKAINAREKARAKVLALEYWQRSEVGKVVA